MIIYNKSSIFITDIIEQIRLTLTYTQVQIREAIKAGNLAMEQVWGSRAIGITTLVNCKIRNYPEGLVTGIYLCLDYQNAYHI